MIVRRSASLFTPLRSTLPLRVQHAAFSTIKPPVPPSPSPLLSSPKSHIKKIIVCGTLLAVGYATQTYAESEQKQERPVVGGNKFHFKHGATVYPHPEKEYKGKNINNTLVVFYLFI